MKLLKEQLPPFLPNIVTLRATGEELDISYRQNGSSQVTAREGKNAKLVISGATLDICSCTKALRRWTARKARSRLVPWLEQVSKELKLPYSQTALRNQRTRWASCSPKKTISINQKLLFIPAHLVEYVFIHELCHTVYLDHSRRFWKLVFKHEPNYRRLDRELRGAWRYVPWWMCEPNSKGY